MSLPKFEGYEPAHLSFSALNGYRMCGEQFRLQRVLRKEQRPGLAGIGGNAVHSATEQYDLFHEGGKPSPLHLKKLFQACWDAEIEKRKEQSPSYEVGDYTVTGKASAKYGGKRNLEWWMDNGPLMVQRWIDWRAETGWSIWKTPEGRAAIELEINIVLPGDTPILMFIDRIMVTNAGQLVPVDIKTGARTPDYPEQLGLYAEGVAQTWGAHMRPDFGYWWDANKGTHSNPLPLAMYTAEYLGGLYDQAVAGINAGSFLARPQNSCANWCGVSKFCAAVGGNPASL